MRPFSEGEWKLLLMCPDNHFHSELAVLILAGGEAKRMGGEKPLRLLGERSLLDRAIDRARSWSNEVAIAVRTPTQVGTAFLPVLIDPPDLEGPLAALASASTLNRAFALIIPCDMPFLPDDLPARLRAKLGDGSAALTASGGRVHPVCGLWRTKALADVRGYAATGRRSVIGFAEAVGYTAVEGSEDEFANVNTQSDLAAAATRLG